MTDRHAIVIGKDGGMVELVAVVLEPLPEETGPCGEPAAGNGETKYAERVLFHELLEGESLVYENLPAALSMIKPRWADGEWTETATEEEAGERRETRAKRSRAAAPGEDGGPPEGTAVPSASESPQALPEDAGEAPAAGTGRGRPGRGKRNEPF